MKNYNYILVDIFGEDALKSKAKIDALISFSCSAIITDISKTQAILKAMGVSIVFFHIPEDTSQEHFFYNQIALIKKNNPSVLVLVIAKNTNFSIAAIRLQVWDYFLDTFTTHDVKNTILRHQSTQNGNQTFFEETFSNSQKTESFLEDNPDFEENLEGVEENEDYIEENDFMPPPMEANFVTNTEQNFVANRKEVVATNNDQIICIKTYGDYKYLRAKDILYLKADNNSTDVHLKNKEVVTAFKTLKSFEKVLPYPFVRIHNSYMINVDYVSRIHTGKSLCFIRDTPEKVPFSKLYKSNVEKIIAKITTTNYIEV